METRFVGILDCTLRDGGYYTNWDFPDSLLTPYFHAMASNPAIYAVEVGYRSPPKGDYHGRFFHIPRSVVRVVRARLQSNQKLAVMLNAKDCQPEEVERLLGDVRDTVDIVRFAVAPIHLGKGAELAVACHELGFEVGINIMYMNSYVDCISLLEPIANVHVDYVALVDSYGSCMPAEVGKVFRAAKEILPQPLGFHGHDNLSLAFANSLAAVEAGAVSLDATIQGMGRGAGNLRTELALSYFSGRLGMDASFQSLAGAVEAFEGLRREHVWGTNFGYMVAGVAGLPQGEVMKWFGTRRYGLGTIVAALQHQDSGDIDDHRHPNLATSHVAHGLKGRAVLIVGGGQSVLDHAEALIEFVATHRLIIVHSSIRRAATFEHADAVQFYCLAGQEIERLRSAGERLLERQDRYIVVQEPPRLKDTAPHRPNVLQVGKWGVGDGLRGDLGPVSDEPPLDLAFSVADALQAQAVYLAGFDGYRNASLSDQENARDVQRALDTARTRWSDRPVLCITPTLYSVDKASVYCLCPSGDAP